MEIEKKIEKANIENIDAYSRTLAGLKDSGLLTEEGIRIQGIGILIRKMEALTQMVDKTNLKLYILEKAVRGEPKC